MVIKELDLSPQEIQTIDFGGSGGALSPWALRFYLEEYAKTAGFEKKCQFFQGVMHCWPWMGIIYVL